MASLLSKISQSCYSLFLRLIQGKGSDAQTFSQREESSLQFPKTFQAQSGLTFRNFWRGFDKESNFFTAAMSEEFVTGRIEVESTFTPGGSLGQVRNLRRFFAFTALSKETRRVWFTGENIRPPLDDSFDHYISFDQDTYGQKNTYFPLLYVETFFPDRSSFQRNGVVRGEVSDLTKPRVQNSSPQRFACAFISNPEPTRMRAVDELRRYGDVDVYGLSSSIPRVDKFTMAKNYKFMICFENDLFPGYVTEKLLDAYLCGTLPLYWGDLGHEKHINRSSFINAKDFASLADFASYVGSLSEAEYLRFFREPLFRSLPEKSLLRRALTGA